MGHRRVTNHRSGWIELNLGGDAMVWLMALLDDEDGCYETRILYGTGTILLLKTNPYLPKNFRDTFL